MSSYLVTGASRGLGFEFLRQLSNDPASTVIGFSRNKKATEEKVKAELNRENVHIVEADPSDYAALKRAVEETSRLTGGTLDYIIANAALVSEYSEFKSIGTLGEDPEILEKDIHDSIQTNVLGTIHLFNLFIPLLRKGSAKKAIAISTGMADVELIRNYDVGIAGPYALSKAALNVAVAKFSAQYRKEGILFMSISPGFVDTGKTPQPTEEELKGIQAMGAAFATYAPNFTGPISSEESAKAVLSVIKKASVENGDGGSFVSHFGDKQWL
ncbi:NAD(P)-binding protein [Macroventuria anomochaeta]|uniref:NAD(P)-binding protein n=1 Tax=Macroventuria anomochaeta TaxID=301207 RepID=A0ACB6RM80_9PLEO|nr:NAD(P)-binding protein [Macroventuria anomochaeta]KAF2622208.1 NAD(P)-binding protein [Macroventuria anomochaeta]